MSPLVSIITPTRNYGHLIGETLRSVGAQTGCDFEVVLVDDGSTDDTSDVIATFDDQILINRLRTEGIGASAARNAGLDIARGDFVMFLDADDILMPDAIEMLMGLNADVAIGQWRNFSDDPNVGAVQGSTRIFPGNTFANVIYSRPVAGCAMFRWNPARFDATLRVSELLDYLLQVGKSDPSVAYVDRPVIAIRQHDSPHRLSVAHDHFEPTHRLDIVKRHRPAYARSANAIRASVDQLTLDLVLQVYRRSGKIDPVTADIDLGNIDAHGILPSSWRALRFAGYTFGAPALRAYERLRG